MNVKTIKELCAAAELHVEAHRVPLTEMRCFSVLSTKSPTAVIMDLVEALLDEELQPDGTTAADMIEAYESRDGELRNMFMLLRNGHVSVKIQDGRRLTRVYWPELRWE